MEATIQGLGLKVKADKCMGSLNVNDPPTQRMVSTCIIR